MTAMLDAALAYAARGWPVFPCRAGSKEPATSHGFKDATTDPARIRAWWAAMPDANIAIATGAPGPDVLDVDVKPDGNGFAGLASIIGADLVNGCCGWVRTRAGGLHLYFTGTSQRNGRIPGRHIDFRATGGYVLAPPSWADADSTGPAGHYRYEGDGSTEPGPADWPSIRAHLDPPPDPPAFRQPAREPGQPAEPGHGRPGDDWASRTSWAQLLESHGWRRTRDLGGGRAMWRRPGKQEGSSATTRDDGGLYVFTTSTDFEPEVPYTKFGALAVLEHGGDHAAAAAALRLAGYGEPAATLAAIPTEPQAAAPPGVEENSDGEPVSSTWRPVDLGPILDGETSGDPPPATLTRTDGACLLYAGKVNAFIGESESGKTWAALLAVAQALAAGQHVIYLDFEDSAGGIVARLLSMGADRGQLAKLFAYIAPDEPLGALAAADLAAVLTTQPPALIIVDGVNAAMTLLGLNLTDNKDVTSFSQRVLRPLKKTGATVLTIDHVTKDREGRGNYAIGAQAKRADIDGAAFIVEAVVRFGRGQQGKLRLTVSKDRPGHVRAISAGATHAGMVVLTPGDDGTITAEISAPDLKPSGEKPMWRPTGFMQKISQHIEGLAGGDSKRGIRAAIKGRNEHIDAAIETLISEGWAARRADARIISVKPFREVSDLQIDDRAHRAPDVPQRAPGTGESSLGVDRAHRAPDPLRRRVGARGTGTPARGTENQDQTDHRAHDQETGPCTGCGEPAHPSRDCFAHGETAS